MFVWNDFSRFLWLVAESPSMFRWYCIPWWSLNSEDRIMHDVDDGVKGNEKEVVFRGSVFFPIGWQSGGGELTPLLSLIPSVREEDLLDLHSRHIRYDRTFLFSLYDLSCEDFLSISGFLSWHKIIIMTYFNPEKSMEDDCASSKL